MKKLLSALIIMYSIGYLAWSMGLRSDACGIGC